MQKVYEIPVDCKKRSKARNRIAFKIRCNHDGNFHGHVHVRKEVIDPWLAANSNKKIRATFVKPHTLQLSFSQGRPVSVLPTKVSTYAETYYFLPEIRGDIHFDELTCLRLELE